MPIEKRHTSQITIYRRDSGILIFTILMQSHTKEKLTYLSVVHHAKHSRLLASNVDLMIQEELCSENLPELLRNANLKYLFLKMYRDCLSTTKVALGKLSIILSAITVVMMYIISY